MIKYRKRHLQVVVWTPEKEADGRIAGYICDALETWGGQLHPDDTLFGSMRVDSVKIGKMTYNNPKPKEVTK